jgi:outer membrane protein assembly factor BamB
MEPVCGGRYRFAADPGRRVGDLRLAGRVRLLPARDDGQLVWRFHAAPEDRQVVSYDRLESVWPVHGSLLLLDGLVYGAAGRSGFLDGGISLFALDPVSGELVHETRWKARGPISVSPVTRFTKKAIGRIC